MPSRGGEGIGSAGLLGGRGLRSAEAESMRRAHGVRDAGPDGPIPRQSTGFAILRSAVRGHFLVGEKARLLFIC